MTCPRAAWSLLALPLGVSLAAARPVSASVGHGDASHAPSATGDASSLENPGEEPIEDPIEPPRETAGAGGASEGGGPDRSLDELPGDLAADVEPGRMALDPAEAVNPPDAEDRGGVDMSGTDDTWHPPPDPLLSDADVPEWPATMPAGASDVGGRVVTGVGLDVVEARQVQEDGLRRARGWTRAGVVGVVAGAALVGGAVAMRLSEPCAFGAGNNCFEEARNRAAATMGIPGGVFIAGGVAMIIAGQVQRSRLMVAPTMAGRGLALTGRF